VFLSVTTGHSNCNTTMYECYGRFLDTRPRVFKMYASQTLVLGSQVIRVFVATFQKKALPLSSV
jgi:hypothetical protein